MSRITRIGRIRPITSLSSLVGGSGSGAGGGPSGQVPTSTGSNGEVAWGSNVATVTVNGTTKVLGPWINFANGSNTTVTVDSVGAVASNTIRIHATGGGGSIDVTDGTTTVSPASEVEFDPASFAVTDQGGGSALVEYIGTGGGGGGSGDLVFLSETILGSAAADITVTGISGSYRDLVVVVTARSATSGLKRVDMRVGNGSIDTGSNYLYYREYSGSVGSGSDSSTSASTAIIGACPGSGATAGAFGSIRIELIDYASTARRKQYITHGFTGGDGTLHNVGGGQWANASDAIERIRILLDGGSNLDTGSRVIIYGRGDAGGSGSVDWALDVTQSGASFANFTSGGGTWSSNGTEIIQTDTGASWRRAKFNTGLALGFPTIIEAECQIVTEGSGGVYRVGIGITKGDTGSNGLSANVDSNTNAWSLDKDNSAAFAGGSITINPSIWYKLRVVTSGGWAHLYIDGTRVGQGFMLSLTGWEDEAVFLTLLSYAASVKFRNIKAWTLSTGAPA